MKYLVLTVLICCFYSSSALERATGNVIEQARRIRRQTTGPLHCGGNYTFPTGYFHTPGFPVGYLSNTTCEWHIRVSPPYTRIKMEFVPSLSLHSYLAPNGTRYCFDYVRVHDGADATAPDRLWCGHGIAPPTLSTGPNLYLKFQSDLFPTSHRGFMVIYAGLTDEATNNCVDLSNMDEPDPAPAATPDKDTKTEEPKNEGGPPA